MEKTSPARTAEGTIPEWSRLAPQPGTRVAVAGGCGGIGRVLVAACLVHGLRVSVLDLKTSFRQHPTPSGVHFIPVDATKEEKVERAFEELDLLWRGLDVLITLVGFTGEKRALREIEPGEWDRLVEGNLRSAYLIARCGLALLHKAGGGSIVHTASGLATHVRPGYGPYASAKAGIIALTKTIALENAPAVRANVVAPAAVNTAFLSGGTGRSRRPVQLDLKTYVRGIPLGRIAEPEDVVGPILFLAGPASRFVTGQVLYVNGGAFMP